MPSYEKTLEVDDDLTAIVHYTAERWGIDQVHKYMSAIETGMEDLATGKSYTRHLDGMSNIIVSKCEHHYIFGLQRTAKPMLILAILHERMHLMRQLKKRLP